MIGKNGYGVYYRQSGYRKLSTEGWGGTWACTSLGNDVYVADSGGIYRITFN